MSDMGRVCALPSCGRPLKETSSGPSRKYCSASHRRVAREQRIRAARAGERQAPERAESSASGPHSGVSGVEYDLGPTNGAPSAPSSEASTPHGVPVVRDVPAGVVRDRDGPYRRLVPEPRVQWYRRRSAQPHASRGVRAPRPSAVDPSQPPLPEWLRARERASTSARSGGFGLSGQGGWWVRVTVPSLASLRGRCGVPIGLAKHRLVEELARRREGVARRQERQGRRLEELELRRGAVALERRQAAAVLRGAPIPTNLDDEANAIGHRGDRRARVASAHVGPARDRVAEPAAWAVQARETLLAALHSLSIHRLRSLLTTVGIVIGVAAVIILVALGEGMKADFNTQFSRLANQILVTPATAAVAGGGAPRKLTDQDVAALQDPGRAPDIASVSPSMTGTVMLTEGQATDRASLVGATVNYLDLLDRTIIAGNWLSPAQVSGNERQAVLGDQVVTLLWGPGANPRQAVGSQIRVNHTTFKVAGVLAADGQSDNVIVVPFGTSRAYLMGGGGEVSQITVKSTSVDTVAQAADEITNVLDVRHFVKAPADRDFNVRTFTDLLTKSNQFVNFLTMFIVAIAAISLIVGGIGVANIMLVSVTERTREIGIRKAVGAPRRAILRQFLSEAVMLTGLGGLVGVILGVGIAEGGGIILTRMIQSFPQPVITPAPVLIAFGVSLLIGLLAGGYPAHRAARLQPIEALRFE